MSGAEPPHGGDAPPPYSETDIYSNSGAAAVPSAPPTHADDVASRMSSNEDIIYTPPDTPRTSSTRGVLTGVPQPGADLYFESRPPPPADIIPQSTLVHALQLETQSLPDDFPFPSDWEKRDINAQDWATFINFLLPDHTTRGNDVILERKLRAEAESEAGDSVSSGHSQAELQRHLLRTNGPEALRDEAQWQANALATVHEWNEGFFAPRGITISIAPSEEELDRDSGAVDGQEQPAQAGGGWWPNPSAFRMDSNGITYGKQFIMDSNGVRLGSIIMDHNGIRMATHDNDTPGSPKNMAGGSTSRNMPGFTHPEPTRGRSHAHDHAEGKGKAAARDRSASSVSSVSSVSSSSTASSLDSLPDYDDVREQQLPTYLNILRDWTSNPNQIRTNTDVVWFKNELKLAKFYSAKSSIDKKELKSQIKVLLKQWKQIQRDQRKLQRGDRTARKKQRRQEKRERRQWKRDMKRSQRDVRRAERDARRHGVPMPAMSPMLVPPGAPMPHSHSMPAMPYGPAMPHMPHGMPGPPPMHFHQSHSRPHSHSHSHSHNHHEHGRHEQSHDHPAHGRFGGRGGWPHHRGRGGRGGFSGAWPPRGPPGCWPPDSGNQQDVDAPPPPNPAIAAKYSAAQGIEDAIRLQQQKADKLEDGPARKAIEGAIANLTQSLSSLRTDADAEYARHIGGAEVAQERSAITNAIYYNSDKSYLNYMKGAKITNVTFPSDTLWHGTYKGKSGYFHAENVKLLPL